MKTKKIAAIRVSKPGSSPDVDSDFDTRYREAALAHCEELYGRGTVSNIITFGTLAAKGSFKQMCTIYGAPFAQANKIANLVPGPIEGVEATIDDLYNPESDRYTEGADFRAATAGTEWEKIIEGAKYIEGKVKSTGVHACFAPGALVKTKEGYQKIEDVQVGDFVLTHRNGYRQVVETIVNEDQPLLRLRAANSVPIDVTPNHPFYVRTIEKATDSRTKGESTRTLSPPYWKEAQELVPKKDVIGIPINDLSELPTHLEILPIENSSFWWLMGRFVGDGWCEEFVSTRRRRRKDGSPYDYVRQEQNAIICYGANESTKNELISKVAELFDYRIDTRTSAHKIYIKHNPELFDFLKTFGKYAHGKRVPENVLNLPKALLAQFLAGYLSADGHFFREEEVESFSTVSKELCLGMMAVVNKVYGVHCSTTFEPRGTMVIEGRTVQCKDRYHVRFSLQKKVKDHSFCDGKYIWASLTEAKKTGARSTVHNLAVVDDNSYTANNLIAHNCGVIISSKALSDTIPLQVRKDDGRIVTQWTYGDLESMGLIKFDFLGLDTVDLVAHTVEYIIRAGKEPPNMLELIHGPMDDKKTYEMLGRGETIGIFQLASDGVQDLLKRMKPTEINDIVATTALYRPGPMGMLSHIKYADRKNGREKFEYPVHPEFKNSPLEKILSKTYGLITYQEQILQISNQIAGMTLQEGDDLRKAMGKKLVDKMAKIKPKFIDGGVKNGYSREAMDVLWETIATFAQYGFNLSHSVAYGLTAYQAAYLKANYPVEFMAALISQNIGRKAKILAFLQEARRMGLKVGSIDINSSEKRVSPDFSNKSKFDIIYGLAGVNSVSEDMADIIIGEREENGSYSSIQDLINRCYPLGVSNKKIYENLTLAGAFDGMLSNRRAIVESLPDMINEAKVKKSKGDSLFDMFDQVAEVKQKDISTIEDYPHLDKLRKEADVIGLYLTSHPLSHAGPMGAIPHQKIQKVLSSNAYTSVKVIGAISEITIKRMKRGGKSISISLDDGTGLITTFLNRNIVRGLDKAVAQKKIHDLYVSGALEIPQEIKEAALDDTFDATAELELGSVYVADIVFKPGTEENPYAARCSSLTKINLADDGSLPVRIRLDNPATPEERKVQNNTLLKIVRANPGDSPVFLAYNESKIAQADDRFWDAIDTMLGDSDLMNEKSNVKKATRTSLMGTVSEDLSKKALANTNFRSWPPPVQDRGAGKSSQLQAKKNPEDLNYRITKFKVQKGQKLSNELERAFGIEAFDFGVFDATLLDD